MPSLYTSVLGGKRWKCKVTAVFSPLRMLCSRNAKTSFITILLHLYTVFDNPTTVYTVVDRWHMTELYVHTWSNFPQPPFDRVLFRVRSIGTRTGRKVINENSFWSKRRRLFISFVLNACNVQVHRGGTAELKNVAKLYVDHSAFIARIK